jgi:hypothetical protein
MQVMVKDQVKISDHTFPIELGGKTVSIEVKLVDAPLE